MICRIADLNIDVPVAGGLAPRCQAYLTDPSAPVDIVIPEENYKLDRWEDLSYEDRCYLESGYHFYARLLAFDGMMLHASALCYNKKAYLFSGPSTVGKSTHTRQWQACFGDVQVFNDDKPAVRCIDGIWHAYGTPWCGKDGININMKAPLGGICFLKQGRENSIRRMSPPEAFAMCMAQTQRFYKTENAEKHMQLMQQLVCTVPVWELTNYPGPEAAQLACDTMTR